MAEIVHAEEQPRPALPIQASRLLEYDEKKRQIFTAGGAERLRTGIADLDDHVLKGGFERGIIVGISQIEDKLSIEGQLISLHALCSTVISNSKANALVITTTNGHFSIELMVTVLQRLLKITYPRESDAQIASRLDEITINRIKITQVHDLEDVCLVWSGETNGSVKVGNEDTQIVVMDSLTAYMSDRLSNAPDPTKLLLEDLSKFIRSRTREQNILTIMHNGTTEVKAKDPPISVFLENPLKPRFGVYFDQFPDLHILVSKIGNSVVAEVLRDEVWKARPYGFREQLWTALTF